MPEYETMFALPSVDDDADTELGVLLMGLGPERLLAGLGVAGAAGDPVTATLLVDQLRHGARADWNLAGGGMAGGDLAAALTAGATRWRAVRAALAAADPGVVVRSAALRRRWDSALRAVTAAAAPASPGERVYLAACWLRRNEIDEIASSTP